MTDNYEVSDMRLVPRPNGDIYNFPEYMPQFYNGTVQNKTTERKYIVCGICTQKAWNDPLWRPKLERSLIDEAKTIEEIRLEDK